MNYFGKIWLKDKRVLTFVWAVDFFAARAFYEKKDQIVHSVHATWGRRTHQH